MVTKFATICERHWHTESLFDTHYRRSNVDLATGSSGPPMATRRYIRRRQNENTEARYELHHDVPDYYQEIEGAAMEGRSLSPVNYDGRKMGDYLLKLRPPSLTTVNNNNITR